MSVKKFKFVSPGVFVDEIDNSQLPELPSDVGPVIIGRTAKGPSMVPVQINSFSDYVETFGNPVYGGGVIDGWREGPDMAAPTYGAYAAQAYLRNRSPITVVRLAGIEDANATDGNLASAGWQTNAAEMNATETNGGAFGLFLAQSGSDPAQHTGSLAAIFYCSEGVVELSGTLADGETLATGTAGLFQSDGTPNQFTAQVRSSTGLTDKIVFNFNEGSKLYIRNVFNTNPTLVNTFAGTNEKTYFLGETFDKNISDTINSDSSSYGVILGLKDTVEGVDIFQNQQEMVLTDASTGWFFSQDLGDQSNYTATDMQKLFLLKTLSGGEWSQSNLKISISNLKASPNSDQPFGTFTVQVRKINDADARISPVETFSNVNLNPNSPDFISRRIGDSYRVWDDTQKRYQTYGDYVNQSRYIRVVLDSTVAAGNADPKFLPYGVYGPTRWASFAAGSGSVAPDTYVTNVIPRNLATGGSFIFVGSGSAAAGTSASFEFPTLPLRENSSDFTLINQRDSYFGVTTNISNTSRLQRDIPDYVRRKPGNADNYGVTGSLEYSWVFSLDDVSGSNADGVLATWVSGSRRLNTSITAQAASGSGYEAVLSAGFNKFTTMLQGGFTGLNILEREPFANRILQDGTPPTNYAFASIERAINTIADPDVVDLNMITIPGITNETLTGKVLEVAENRGDALAIIDLKGGYEPETESTQSATARIGSVSETVSNLNLRNINNSYGCAYYPWVQINDTVTTGGSLWVPPSVVALGTLASSEAKTELWFAPAGFTRGGLTEGSAGLPVSNVRQRLTSDDRDTLYTANINPIAQFPAEGIVVFGQKTLQVTDSALDRINVRRMLIYVKREISRIAATLLFDQNVSNTWNRFLARVNPFLTSVRVRLGLSDFKVILDNTTTTPELVDRNIMYAKIFLKPARAIEFIALDFVVTRSGASFED